MDFIKSWYEYFRGKTTVGSPENKAEVLKNEFSQLGSKDQPIIDVNPIRENLDLGSSDIMRIFFGDSENHSNESDLMSDIESPWSFGNDIFSNARKMHREFLDMVNEMDSTFSNMQSFIFQDPEQNSGNCSSCDGHVSGESLRDHYLKVPALGSVSSDNENKMDIIIPGNEADGIITCTDGKPKSFQPNFHQTQKIVSVSVGPDGVVKTTNITTYSNGKTVKTVIREDL